MATTIVRPNSDSSVAFTPLGAGTNHSEVSESSPDGDSSYNTSSDATETDLDMFTFADAGIDSGDIISSVILTVRARDTGGGQAQLSLRVSHDSLYEGAAENLGATYADLTDDVTGDESWLPADFDGQSITIGYRVMGNSSSRERRATQVFLTIIHAAPADISLASFRWRDDDGDEAGATWHQLKSVDHTITVAELDTNIRIRFGMRNTGGTLLEDDWQVEFELNGTGGFSDMNASSGAVRSNTSTQVDELDPTTEQLNDPGTFVAGGIDETDGRENNFSLDAGEDTEDEYVLQPRSAVLSGGDFVDLRIRVVGGESVTYTETARLTVQAGGATVERTVTDGLFMRDQDTRNQDHTQQEGLLFDEKTPKEQLHQQLEGLLLDDATLPGRTVGKLVTDGLLLDDTSLIQAIRQLLQTDGLLLPDVRISELDRVLMDGLLVTDLVVKGSDKLVTEGLLLADDVDTVYTPAGAPGPVEVERTVTDGLLLVDAIVREQEGVHRDSLFLRDQSLRETLKVLLDNLALKTRAIKERESTLLDRLPLADGSVREQEHVHLSNLFVSDFGLPQKVLDRLFTDNLFLDERTFKTLELTQIDKLLLGEASSRIRELLVSEGLLLSDTGATAITRADAAAIVWALLKRVDWLGMDIGFSAFPGMATGRVDPIGMETGYLRMPEIS